MSICINYNMIRATVSFSKKGPHDYKIKSKYQDSKHETTQRHSKSPMNKSAKGQLLHFSFKVIKTPRVPSTAALSG